MTELWVERTGVRRYTGHSSRGAQVLIGSEDVDGVFTPGELMKIAIQKGGPHVGMLNDILRTAQVDWKDIHVVWTEDVSGDKGPAAESNFQSQFATKTDTMLETKVGTLSLFTDPEGRMLLETPHVLLDRLR